MAAFIAFCIALGLPGILLFVLIRRIRRRRQMERAGLSANPAYHAFRSLYGTPRECPATMCILAVLCLLYACELVFAYGPTKDLSPSLLTLIALGGVDHNLVFDDGEWYRLLTAVFLHGGPMHLLMNGIALFYAGMLLEKLLGPAWFLAIFFISAVCGSLFSTQINPPNLISVGASGAIMGLFGVMLIASFRLRPEEGRAGLLSFSLRVLVPSLLPSASSGHIDLGAHAGGAVAGVGCGFLMLALWPALGEKPAFGRLAAGISVLGVLSAAAGFGLVTEHYGGYAQLTQIAGHIIPPEQMPKTAEERQAKSAALVRQYPDDPRGHMDYSVVLMKSGDMAGAEQEMRIALANTDKFKVMFKKYEKLKNLEYAILAFILADEGKTAEAREAARHPCTAGRENAVPDATLNNLMSYRLCTPAR
jgi:rhomboid protease GluP